MPRLYFLECLKMETLVKVMNQTNNYFARLCEKVTDATISGSTVSAQFKGKYKAGQLLRVHGAYRNSFADLGEGEVYHVVSYDENEKALTLDKELHTQAPVLFIAYLEPTSEFMKLCEQIKAWNEKNAGREGLASESIDGYSYSLKDGGDNWSVAFKAQLKEYKQPAPTRLYYARECLPWQ